MKIRYILYNWIIFHVLVFFNQIQYLSQEHFHFIYFQNRIVVNMYWNAKNF